MKKIFSICMIFALLISLVACDNSDKNSSTQENNSSAQSGTGSVYYLNFKPEQADEWVALAQKYTKETGVSVTVVTASSGTYESTLKSEIVKTNAPTLFQVNGPVGLATWKDYCYNLSDTELYRQLSDKEFALKNGEEVAAIAYVIETYGLIYNKTLLQKYCSLKDAKIKNASEINNFATLKAVAEDMQSKKQLLGIQGAFASAGMDSSSDWRFKTHLANLPIYYEYQQEGITHTNAIKGTFLKEYKAIWDLYLQNSTCDPKLISSKTGDDALSEFVMGEAVFYQNGTWAYQEIKKDGSLSDDEIGFLPIYIGVNGEENQGLCTGSENYWCINKNASQENVKATLDFLTWCITSETGKKSLSEEMGFVCPFKGFTEEYLPQNPLVLSANQYLKDGKRPVAWCFPTMPSDTFRNHLGGALLKYAQGTGTWEEVERVFVEDWKNESNATSKKE